MFEKGQGLYHNKVNLSLTPAQKLGNQAHNCKRLLCVTLAITRRALKRFITSPCIHYERQNYFKMNLSTIIVIAE